VSILFDSHNFFDMLGVGLILSFLVGTIQREVVFVIVFGDHVLVFDICDVKTNKHH